MGSKSTFSNSTSNSYALALYELSKENSELEKIENEMESLKKLLKESSDFKEMISSPTILKDDKKENKNAFTNVVQQNSISNKDRLSKTSIKLKKKTIFNPQPYRIILRLSGANPSAPAETVTEALRTAGVQFEVEKIERFDEEGLSKDSSFKR